MDDWYVSDGLRQTGPHSYQELAQAFLEGRIPPTAQVWKEGSPVWAPARQHFPVLSDPLVQIASASREPEPVRRRYVDHLRGVRIGLLMFWFVLIAFGLMVGPDNVQLAGSFFQLGGCLFIGWLIFGVANIIMHAAWKNNHPDD